MKTQVCLVQYRKAALRYGHPGGPSMTVDVRERKNQMFAQLYVPGCIIESK